MQCSTNSNIITEKCYAHQLSSVICACQLSVVNVNKTDRVPKHDIVLNSYIQTISTLYKKGKIEHHYLFSWSLPQCSASVHFVIVCSKYSHILTLSFRDNIPFCLFNMYQFGNFLTILFKAQEKCFTTKITLCAMSKQLRVVLTGLFLFFPVFAEGRGHVDNTKNTQR